MWNAARLRARLNLETALRALPAPAWAVATAFAAARLLAPGWVLPATLLTALAGAAWLVVHVRRRGWTDDQARVVLDRAANAGGLLLALNEVPNGAWEVSLRERLRDAKPPPMKVRTPIVATLASVLFAIAAALVPMPEDLAPKQNAAAQARVEQLVEKEEALALEEAMPPAVEEEVARLRDALDDGRFDAADWEASDNVAQALDDAASKRDAALARAAEAADRLAEQLSKEASGEAAAREREELEEALAALSGDEGKADREQANTEGEKKPGDEQTAGNQGDSDGGTQAGDKASAGGDGKKPGDSKPGSQDGKPGDQKGQQRAGGTKAPTTKPDAQALRDALNQRRQQLAQKFGEGKQPSGEGQASAQKRPGSGRGRSSSRGDGQGDPSDEPGGGPSHGPAPDSPLRFGDETKFQEDRLAFAPLPEGNGGEDSGQLWGMQKLPPRKGDREHAAAPAGSSNGATDTPGVRDATIPPRHRELVRRYFGGTAREAP